jgi:hypothetical protein
MTEPNRLQSIKALRAQGLSLRAVARQMDLSDRTIRNELAADSAASMWPRVDSQAATPPADNRSQPAMGSEPAPSATADIYPDYIPPGPGRVIPTPTRDELLDGGVRHPGKAWIRCPGCHSPAWRTAPGSPVYECSSVVGPRGLHPPTQQPDADGVPQIAWSPYRFQEFPVGLPPA